MGVLSGRFVRTIAMFAVIGWLTAIQVVSAQETRTTFEAFDLKTGKPVFRGEAATHSSPDRISESLTYLDAEGQITQRMELEFERATLTPTKYRREYPPTGQWDAIEREGNRVRILYKAQDAREPESFNVNWADLTALPATVVPQILRAAETLKAGKDVVLAMVVPSRQDVYAFRLRQDKSAAIDGKPTWVVRLEPDSMLIRRLVDPMYFYFAADGSGDLLEYRGRTSVINAKGDGIDARIVYRRSPS